MIAASAPAPMRIARVLTRLNLGGPARQVLASDPLLAQRGHVVRVFTGEPDRGEGDLFERGRAAGIDLVRVPGLSRGVQPVRDLAVRRRLARAFAEFDPDVVHTHASKAGAVGRMAARRVPRAARVHTFHGHVLEGYFSDRVSSMLVAHERRLARATDRIVAVSHATADDLVRLGVTEEERLVVIPPGVELDALLELGRPATSRTLVGAEGDAILVGVVGRLAPVKRPDVALAAFATVAERHARAHLVFVGDGELRGELEAARDALAPGVRERVHLVGAQEDMARVLAELDLVLLTSRTEGMPVALIEAAAAALPVVATPVGGVPEIVVHERTGLLGESEDELAFHLDALLSDEALRVAMGGRARLRVRDRHGASALADRLEELYEAVTEEAS